MKREIIVIEFGNGTELNAISEFLAKYGKMGFTVTSAASLEAARGGSLVAITRYTAERRLRVRPIEWLRRKVSK